MAPNTTQAYEFKKFPINKITISDCNVRASDKDKGIEELAESIKAHGLLQPVVLLQEDDTAKLIIGQRRLRAFRELRKKGLTKYSEIPAIVLGGEHNEETLKLMSLTENIHRVELNRADVADVVGYLYGRYGRSAKKVAATLGKSVAYVYDYLEISRAPEEVRQMLSRREITKQDVKRVMEIAPGDEPKMIDLATKMKALAVPEKTRLVDAARRNPKASTQQLIIEARRPRIEEKVIVSLTPDLNAALDSAAKHVGLSREETAKKALREWLADKGYYAQQP